MNYQNLFELLLANLDEGVIVTDENAVITLYNEPVTKIDGVDPEKVIGMSIYEVFPKLEREHSSFYLVLKSGKPIINRVQVYRNYQNIEVSVLTTTIPIYDGTLLTGAFQIYKDLTQVIELSQEVLDLQSQLYAKRSKKSPLISTPHQYGFNDITGQSHIINSLKHKAARILESPSPVLIYGETGTGKELFVQAIHNESKTRGSSPFIAQNCAALPANLLESILFGTDSGSYTGAKDKAGLFELADKGTLFLDEINSLDYELQGKLLRVLQDGVIRRIGSSTTRSVDVRIMAATNEPPEVLIKNNILRKDLFYRLNVIYFSLPPLRERKEDIPELAATFLRDCNIKMNKAVKNMSEEVLNLFLEYPWPGNIRELEHVVESAMNFIDGDVLEIHHILEHCSTHMINQTYQQSLENGISSKVVFREHHNNSQTPSKTTEEPQKQWPRHWHLPDSNFKETMEAIEIQLIKDHIVQSNGNYTKAAKSLGLPKQTLQNKLKKYQLSWTAIHEEYKHNR